MTEGTQKRSGSLKLFIGLLLIAELFLVFMWMAGLKLFGISAQGVLNSMAWPLLNFCLFIPALLITRKLIKTKANSLLTAFFHIMVAIHAAVIFMSLVRMSLGV